MIWKAVDTFTNQFILLFVFKVVVVFQEYVYCHRKRTYRRNRRTYKRNPRRNKRTHKRNKRTYKRNKRTYKRNKRTYERNLGRNKRTYKRNKGAHSAAPHETLFSSYHTVTSVIYLTNGFQVAVRLFSNRSQMTSKCGKNKKVAHEAQPSV